MILWQPLIPHISSRSDSICPHSLEHSMAMRGHHEKEISWEYIPHYFHPARNICFTICVSYGASWVPQLLFIWSHLLHDIFLHSTQDRFMIQTNTSTDWKQIFYEILQLHLTGVLIRMSMATEWSLWNPIMAKLLAWEPLTTKNTAIQSKLEATINHHNG